MPSPSQSSNPSSSQVYGLLIAVAILSAAGFLALYFKADQDAARQAQSIASLQMQVAALSNGKPIQQPVPSTVAPSGQTRVLAVASDMAFALRGEGVCDGIYRIGEPQKSKEDPGATMYDLIHPWGPEESDAGQVSVQLDGATTTFPTVVFRDDGRIASAIIMANPEDCKLSITAR